MSENLVVAGKLEGTVVAITEAGNLITDIEAERLRDAPADERVAISCDEHETRGIFTAGHHELPSTLLALLGPTGKLELEVVGASASAMLGVRVGQKVLVSW